MKRICVICGSKPGRDGAYGRAATDLGQTLAARGIGIVYGGVRAGLMGILADAAVTAGGSVIGVITPDITARTGHDGVHLETVATMHERKQRFADLADGYIALPGGFGTLEELLEALTWNQLGIHDKPVGLLNAGGYYDGLLAFFQHAQRERFIHREHAAVLADDDPARLLEAMARHRAAGGQHRAGAGK